MVKRNKTVALLGQASGRGAGRRWCGRHREAGGRLCLYAGGYVDLQDGRGRTGPHTRSRTYQAHELRVSSTHCTNAGFLFWGER